MKKYLCLLLLIFSPMLAFANTEADSVAEDKNPFIQFFTEPWYSFTFDEGVSYAQITRIEKMEDRSNFVRENFLAGAFCNVKTENLDVFNLLFQLSAYYPFRTHFNGMQQFPKNPIPYAVDTFTGITFNYDKFQYVLFDFSLGMHFMYHLTDEYHMLYLGLGMLDTIEFPISRTWTLVNNYFFSYDNANLGSNQKIQKFCASYQYHIDLGFRYSFRNPNEYYYIKNTKAKEKKAK